MGNTVGNAPYWPNSSNGTAVAEFENLWPWKKMNRWIGALTVLFSATLCAGSSLASERDADHSVATQFIRPDEIPYPAYNPPSEAKIELGRRLFFERRLSGADSLSCATCHVPAFAWTDRRPLSRGETGAPLARRTPPLQDVAWNQMFARDGRIETLEGFVLGPVRHPKEMNQDLTRLPGELTAVADYVALHERAFGGGVVTLDGIALSLGAYVRTLRSTTAPFDRWIGGDETALSPAAKDGFALFTGKAGCADCHGGWRFTDQGFHDIGSDTNDRGRGNLLPDDIAMQFAFKTPSLRNVAIRPPYMHDGSLGTLAAVLDHYQSGPRPRPSLSPRIRTLDLSAQEKVNVIKFLKSLTDDMRMNHLPDMGSGLQN